jgi:Cu/Ag efflux protein CusF
VARTGTNRLVALLGAFAVATAAACARRTDKPAAETTGTAASTAQAKASHVFHGTVTLVDTTAKALSVANENVPGWMSPMTMTYTVSNPEVFASIKVGDHISATVYDGDFRTLYDVKIDAGAGKTTSR